MSDNKLGNATTRATVGVVATVFLGVVGSALWERLFSPLLDWVVQGLVAGSGRLSGWYLDNLYSTVGMGLTENASYFIVKSVMVSIVMLSLAGFVLTWRIWRELREADRQPEYEPAIMPRPMNRFIMTRGGGVADCDTDSCQCHHVFRVGFQDVLPASRGCVGRTVS